MQLQEVKLQSDRYLVVLEVPWSIYAKRAVANARSSFATLVHYQASLVVLDEDDPAVRDWLVTLGVRDFTDYAVGTGALIWLTNGQLKRFVPNGSSMGHGIATVCQEIWDQSVM